jgi:thioredoxin reductase
MSYLQILIKNRLFKFSGARIFHRSLNIEVDFDSQPIYNENYETNIKGLFIAGDILFQNGGSISTAYQRGSQCKKIYFNRLKAI